MAAVTNGRDFLEQPTTKQKVVWLTEESPKIVVQRAVEMGVDGEQFVLVVMGKNPPAQLKQAVELHHPQIVVIDTLFRFAMLEDENVAGAWLPVVMLLDDISKDGPAILILAHSQKRDHATEYRGSSAIGGYVDAILQMKKVKASKPNVREMEGKGRLYFGKPFKVQYDGKTEFSLLQTVEEVHEEVEEISTRSLILNVLSKKPRTSLQLIDDVGRRKGDVYKTIKELDQEKAIKKSKDGWKIVTAEDELLPVEGA